MPLSEQRRKQLDGIVQQAIANNEPEDNIQFIVNDFKGKYENEAAPSRQESRLSKVDQFIDKAQRPSRLITNLLGNTRTLEEAGGVAAGYAPNISLKESAGESLRAGASVGSLLLPGAGTLAGRAAQSGAVGATVGAGTGLAEDKDAAGVALSTLLGGLLGAGTTAGGEKAVRGLKKGAESVSKATYNRLVRTPQNQVDAGRELLGEGLLKRGVTGNNASMASKVGSFKTKNIERAKAVLESNAGAKVDITPVRESLKQLKAKLSKTPGASTAGVDAVLKGLGRKKSLDLTTAQTLKQDLQAAVNTGFLNENITGVREAQKTAARALRKSIETSVPDIAPVNKEIEFLIRAAKQLDRQSAQVGGITEGIRRFGEAGGLAYSALTGNPMIAGAVLGERVISSPQVQTNVSRKLFNASQKSINPKTNSAIERIIAAALGRTQ